ncbi:MAG: hypothetical protein WBA22_04870 [Candidatus Methanofastidiosia archaeon]
MSRRSLMPHDPVTDCRGSISHVRPLILLYKVVWSAACSPEIYWDSAERTPSSCL